MPTTIQNPQPMSSPFLRPLRANAVSVVVVDHHCSGELVVPALLALVEGDPEKTQEYRDHRNEVGEVATDQLSHGRWPVRVGVDDSRRDEHLPRRRAPVAPEEDRG